MFALHGKFRGHKLGGRSGRHDHDHARRRPHRPAVEMDREPFRRFGDRNVLVESLDGRSLHLDLRAPGRVGVGKKLALFEIAENVAHRNLPECFRPSGALAG